MLCARREELIHGQLALLSFDSPPSVETAAQHYAIELVNDGASSQNENF